MVEYQDADLRGSSFLRVNLSGSRWQGVVLAGRRAAATVERARALPAPALDESVEGEFSFLQTLRHLVFVADRCIHGPVFAPAT